jgi:hypothetical protein
MNALVWEVIRACFSDAPREEEGDKEKRRSYGGKLVGVILISARFVSTEREREEEEEEEGE